MFLGLVRLVLGTSCSWDVLCLGHFEAWDVCIWDVLYLERFVTDRFVVEMFCLRTFCRSIVSLSARFLRLQTEVTQLKRELDQTTSLKEEMGLSKNTVVFLL
jgi:hypothetical protein